MESKRTREWRKPLRRRQARVESVLDEVPSRQRELARMNDVLGRHSLSNDVVLSEIPISVSEYQDHRVPLLERVRYRALTVRQISGTFDSSVNTGAITLPGADEWGWPSRCPISWMTVRQNMFQSLLMAAHVGQCQWASEIVHCV
jgi:hypothetical protein